ncbi:MAG: hypothetical protein M1818_000305 [Claussenomyces sp. TS43310]|nr:MAG: hypothetical protein M1818_000305 [Claussenomyces sp. TS43310]
MAAFLRSIAHPPKYLTASLVVSLGGLLNGLDTGTIGVVTTMAAFDSKFGTLSSSIHGIVVSSVLLTAAVGSLFAGSISDGLGRTRAIAIGALIFGVGAALEAGAANLGMFIGGRCVVGIGEGVFFSTLVVYICEISPPTKRGPLASTVQLLITLGICLGYFICYGTTNINSSLAWRLPLALQAVIALALAVMSYLYLPPSPRWLAYKGRKEEASVTWDQLGVSGAEREKDLLQNPTLQEPSVLQSIANQKTLIGAARRNIINAADKFGKESRMQVFLAIFLMSMQQLSGIDGVLYYAPLLFQQAGISSKQASFLASGVSAILIFVSTIPAFLLADKWGRRSSTLYGGLVISGCMLLIGSLYASDSVHSTYGVGRWIVIITIYVFVIGYCMTWAVGVKIYASEIQPVKSRATATALAQTANCITNFFVAFITPVLLAKSSFGIYFLFGGASILTVGVCVLFMPETRGRSLESIGEAFIAHKAADMSLVRLIRGLSSRLRMTTRKEREPGVLHGASDSDGVELVTMGGVAGT